MKAHLLYDDRDTSLDLSYLPRRGFTLTGSTFLPQAQTLVDDLDLGTLLHTMAHGDNVILEVSKFVTLGSLTDRSQILYRQGILDDARRNPDLFKRLYSIAKAAIIGEQGIFHPFAEHPTLVLHRAVEVLELFVEHLQRLRALADDHLENVGSLGMRDLLSMLSLELSDDYFGEVTNHLVWLKFRNGTLTSAKLGKGNRGASYALRKDPNVRRTWRDRIGLGPTNSYSFQLAPRDEAGARYLSELSDRGLNLAANAVAQSVDHILSFFKAMCIELAFYIGCLNLEDSLTELGLSVCIPDIAVEDELRLNYEGIYDVSLGFHKAGSIVGNTASGDGRRLIMITGANSGGKSTLLRSIGLAQLMMQAGMFVAADSFSANLVSGIFSHFIREEDKAMISGKLDEELNRMSMIVDQITPGCLMLFNESFSATNEREGAEIAEQVVTALLDCGIKVVFVTHQFALASFVRETMSDSALFLRAERETSGERSFRVIEGEPLVTSFGADLYQRIGGWTRRSTDVAG
jgi:hypothetical protein